MENNTLEFKHPSFIERIKSMLSVDLYRLFHTPVLYVFLGIAAIIAAMVGAMADPDGTLYPTTWSIIAANKPLYVIDDIGNYANMNMVFIFGGILVSIFIGHDFKSGYVKQLFTTHPKKIDYMVSKTITCAISMMGMCVTYFLGGLAAGIFTGKSMDVNVLSLLIAVIGKMLMSFGWASLYVFINTLLRKEFFIAIALSFFFGTGIEIIGFAAILGNSSILNIFLYGASVSACLTSGGLTILVCLACSLAWTLIYNLLGTLVLSVTDIY